MKKLLLGIFVLVTGLTFAQEKDPVIMTINDKPVYKSEFEQIYWKNKKEDVATKEDLDEYLELFINFKLKVEAAEAKGLDTLRKFKSELAGYRAQLERPYLVDQDINEKLIEEAYAHMKTEVRASHILFDMPNNPQPKDSARAYNKALEVRQQIIDGKITFEEAAKRFSKDPSVKNNNGDLGYFSAFRMVYPFEKAAYQISVGEISMPVRTRFGYHLIKTTDKREGRGKIKVAHLMIRVKPDASPQQKANAKKKIYEIYGKFQTGADFAQMAKEYSEDRQSAVKGGELGWINPGETFMRFDSAAFSLKNDGDITEPILTRSGWHIIKRLGYKPIGSLDEMRSEIKSKIQRDTRGQISKFKFTQNLKDEYGFVEEPKSIEDFYKVVDPSIFEGKWDVSKAENLKGNLFSFAGIQYTQQDFAEYLSKNQQARNVKDIQKFVNDKYYHFVSDQLIKFEKTQLERKHPDFKALLKEYRDGILLFEVTDQEVWSKAMKDTSGLKAFYEANKDNYMWPDRVQAQIFSSTDKKIAKTAYKMVKKGKLQTDSIVNYLNKDSQLNLNFEEGTFNSYEKEEIKKYDWADGLNKPVLLDGKYIFVVIQKRLPSQPKTLQEAKGIITADYQDYLEKNWLEALKAKYSVEVNKDVLYTIKNKPKK